jgi:hypothetical protein
MYCVVQPALKICQTHFVLQKIREILKSVRPIFDVFSRYRSIPGEHMINHQNDKSDSGRTHPGTDKIEQCVLPLSTR